MKTALKIILFSFLSVVGIFGLVLGGMYLFGGFDEKPVFAQELHFSKTQVISSTAFEIDLLTTTENVTRRTVKLEITGDNIIYFEPTATIGGRVSIAPRRDDNNKNIGGYVKLTARYSDEDSTSTAIATCHIIIDVPVDEVITNKIDSKMYGEDILLLSQNSKISDLIGVSPANSLMPYLSPTRLYNTPFSDIPSKKVFLQALVNGEANENVKLRVGNVESSLIEVPYTYSASQSSFVLSQDIFVLTKQPNVEVSIASFVVPTYELMNSGDVTEDRVTSLGLASSLSSFYVKNYSIDGMTFDKSDKTMYLGETKNFYINNPLVTGENADLNLSLFNNDNITVDDALIKDYLTINITDNGSTYYNVPLFTDNLAKSEWYFSYNYNSFYTYKNYSLNSTDNNKIKVELIYDDGDSLVEDSFFIVPNIRNVDSLQVNNTSNSFIVKNGEKFDLNDKVRAIFSSTPLSERIGYFLQYGSRDIVSTMPSILGNYKVTFDFALDQNSYINSIQRASNWADIKDTSITMTQNGEVVFKITYDNNGNSVVQTNEEVKAGVIVNAVIDSCTLTNPISTLTNLFTISTLTSGNVNIHNRQTKFYAINNGVVDNYPYLSINSIVYKTEFDYFIDGDINYIFLTETIDDNENTLNGVGSFTILASNIFKINNEIFLLSSFITFEVLVIEVINSGDLLIYQDEDDTSFSSEVIEFNEDDSAENKEGYLYITSPMMMALSSAISENKLSVSFIQDFGKSDEELRTSPSLSSILSNDQNGDKLRDIKNKLNSINSGAIIFDDTFVPVIKDGHCVGYKLKYTIQEVYTITLDGEDLPSNFNIYVTYSADDQNDVLATFVLSSQNQNFVTFKINDKVFTGVGFNYGGEEVYSLKLEASLANDGGLEWRVNETSTIKSLGDLTYGFKYNNTSDIVPNTCNKRLLIEDNTTFKDLSGAFYSFDSNGVLSFKNLPYDENGKKVRFEINMDTLDDNNSHYVYNSSTNTFEKTIYDEVLNGKYVEFTIYGMEIGLEDNQIEVVGSKGSSIKLLSSQEDSIFKVTMSSPYQSGITSSSIVKYEEFFTLSILQTINQKAYQYVSIDSGNLEIVKEFLKNEMLRFHFSYFGDDEFAINIQDSNIFDKEILCAFDIEVEQSFQAPSTQAFALINYKLDTDSTELIISASQLNGKNTDKYIIDNNEGTITFKTYYENFFIDFNLTITCVDDDETIRSVDVEFKDILVTPLYQDSEIIVGRVVDAETGEQIEGEMMAGFAGELSISNGSITFNGGLESAMTNSLISKVSISFEDTESTPSVLATEHMSQNGLEAPDLFGFFSYDLNFEKYVKVIFDISFTDGGHYVVSKILHIYPNFDILWSSSSIDNKVKSLNSGESIVLTNYNNYKIYRNGEYSGLAQEEFKESEMDTDARYSRESFEFLDESDAIYFDDNNSILTVKYLSDLAGQTKTVNLIFKYIIDTDIDMPSCYYLDIILPLSITIFAD